MAAVSTTSTTLEHAVVLGGSMAGLLAAAALARHARRVTVIDRDELADGPHHRKGTPQDHQAHLLLDRGRVAIEHLLPGFFDELVAQGAQKIDVGQDLWWFHYGRWKVRCDTPYRLYVQTRPFLEHHVRRRLRALPNVELRRTEVIEPRLHDGGVAAVRLRSLPDRTESELPCDLLVDALGRASSSAQWLEGLDYGTPHEERTQMGLGYASRVYRRPASAPADWSCYVVYGARPSQRRHGFLLTVEDDRWFVTVMGYAGDHPPGDPEGFEAFLRSLDRPELYELVRRAEPLTPPRTYRYPYQRWLHYEGLHRLPGGYAVVGDALCSFDPIFGQGMAVAAMQAEALDRALARGQGFDSVTFARTCGELVKNPWLMTVGEALRYPMLEGSGPPGLPLLHRFLDRVFDCSTTDPVVYRAFLDVMQLHAGPEALFHPRVLWRLVRGRPAQAGAAAPVLHPG